jgi:RNA polymerase sigma-70 factor, ECF subfamily
MYITGGMHETPRGHFRLNGSEPGKGPRRLVFRGSEVVPDDAMSVWIGAVSHEQALEREFEARLHDSYRLAFRVALSVLRHREDAEDVAQEAFVRAHASFSAIRDRERFRAWLVRTTFRLALDRMRGERRRTRREEAVAFDAPIEAASSEHEVMQGEVRKRVADAVAALPEKLRLVMVLVAIEEQDLASVARLLELPEGTVKSRLHRARKELAEKLRWLVNDTTTR